MRQFEDLQASHLYCGQCRRSMPVSERLLLVLPDGYLFEYYCRECGAVVGDKKTRLEPRDRRLIA